MQVASKKVYWKNNRVFQTLAPIATEKDILSELNRCNFQIYLKYIKLVIPKILFKLVLCSFNIYFKITCPPQQNYPPTKIKISDPPSKDFSEIFNPKKLEGGGACHERVIKRKVNNLNMYNTIEAKTFCLIAIKLKTKDLLTN